METNEHIFRKLVRKTLLENIGNITNSLLIQLFLANGFTEQEVNNLEIEDYFDNVKLDGDNLYLYRKLAIKRGEYETFKENFVANNPHLGNYWSLNSFMEVTPYGHDEFDNTEANVYLIQITGLANIYTDINWIGTKQLYQYSDVNFIAEQEIVLKKINIIEILNEDTEEKINLNYSYHISYKLNENYANISTVDYNKLLGLSEYISSKYPRINQGGCAVFAKAFHDLTQLPYALIFDDGLPDEDPPIHVMIALPNGNYYDGDGIKTKKQLQDYYRFDWSALEQDDNLQGNILILKDKDGSILNNFYEDLGSGLFSTCHKDDYSKIKTIIKKFL